MFHVVSVILNTKEEKAAALEKIISSGVFRKYTVEFGDGLCLWVNFTHGTYTVGLDPLFQSTILMWDQFMELDLEAERIWAGLK